MEYRCFAAMEELSYSERRRGQGVKEGKTPKTIASQQWSAIASQQWSDWVKGGNTKKRKQTKRTKVHISMYKYIDTYVCSHFGSSLFSSLVGHDWCIEAPMLSGTWGKIASAIASQQWGTGWKRVKQKNIALQHWNTTASQQWSDRGIVSVGKARGWKGRKKKTLLRSNGVPLLRSNGVTEVFRAWERPGGTQQKKQP